MLRTENAFIIALRIFERTLKLTKIKPTKFECAASFIDIVPRVVTQRDAILLSVSHKLFQNFFQLNQIKSPGRWILGRNYFSTPCYLLKIQYYLHCHFA